MYQLDLRISFQELVLPSKVEPPLTSTDTVNLGEIEARDDREDFNLEFEGRKIRKEIGLKLHGLEKIPRV